MDNHADATNESGSAPQYGSDVMVDALRAYGLRYAAMNPGASFRGLHDSIVNHAGNTPQLLECPHEKIAVGLAHGYTKASGEPMAVILHNVVGLLQGTMGIYYAYLDRIPMVVIGGTGPMAYEGRRPNIDWIHTANVQANAVRDFTKWDDQPATIGSVNETIARGYRVAICQPQGPVYLTMDAGLQEAKLTVTVPPLDPQQYGLPSRMGADQAALSRLADALMAAERPMIVCGYVGRDPAGFEQVTELAELLGAGVIDSGWRLNFPNRHPLNVTESDAIIDADVVLFLDVKDMAAPTSTTDPITRESVSLIPEDATVLDLGFHDLELSSWAHDFAQLHRTDLQVTADTAMALPELLERCRAAVSRETKPRGTRREQRALELQAIHDELWATWAEQIEDARDLSPVAPARLCAEVWEVVQHYDWVLTAGTAKRWALRSWDFDRGYRHPGRDLGTATQISISLGVALAHKGSDRLVVDLQPDGDLMFDVGALWVAAYYELPLLVVMFNNRAYYNDWEHQEWVARDRGTDVSRAYIGMEIDEPAPDFANLAQSFGWWAEGPIDDPSKVRDAVDRAARHVSDTGLPALVDVVCQYR